MNKATEKIIYMRTNLLCYGKIKYFVRAGEERIRYVLIIEQKKGDPK